MSSKFGWFPDSLLFPSVWVKSPTAGQDCFGSSGQWPILFPASSSLTVNCCTMSAIFISTAPHSCHIELIISVATEKWTLLTWAPHQLPIWKPTTKNQLNEWPLCKMSSLPRICSLNLHSYCVFDTRLPQSCVSPSQGLSLLSSLCCVLRIAGLSFWVIFLSLLSCHRSYGITDAHNCVLIQRHTSL